MSSSKIIGCTEGPGRNKNKGWSVCVSIGRPVNRMFFGQEGPKGSWANGAPFRAPSCLGAPAPFRAVPTLGAPPPPLGAVPTLGPRLLCGVQCGPGGGGGGSPRGVYGITKGENLKRTQIDFWQQLKRFGGEIETDMQLLKTCGPKNLGHRGVLCRGERGGWKIIKYRTTLL